MLYGIILEMFICLFISGFAVLNIKKCGFVNKQEPILQISVYDSVDNFKTIQMRISLIILLFVEGLISCSEEIVITEEEISNDLLYTEANISPYTGKCKVVYTNTDLVKEVLTFRKGRLNGDAQYYHQNGKIKWRGRYDAGMISGKWEYWDENGKIMYVVNYKNDTLEGEFMSYHQNGTIKEKGCYLNNSRTGEWIVYSESGKVTGKRIY